MVLQCCQGLGVSSCEQHSNLRGPVLDLGNRRTKRSIRRHAQTIAQTKAVPEGELYN